MSQTSRAISYWCAFGLLMVPVAMSDVAFSQDGPEYSPDGKQLVLPVGFEKWVFVGANLGLGYSEESKLNTPREAARSAASAGKSDGTLNPGEFHNIYLVPEAFDEYTTSGKFPEGTVLVMDVYAAQQKEPQKIVDRGFFEADRTAIEVAVKNSKRPDRTSDSNGDWAYYVFSMDDQGHLAPSATAFADSKCYACHKAHADDDNVWVQFYPVIRKPK